MSLVVLLIAGGVLGGWALRPFGLDRTLEDVSLRLLVGLCLCAVLVLAVGSVSLRAAQLAVILFALAGFGYELFVYSQRRTPRPSLVHAPLDAIEWACAAAITAALAMTFLGALAPVTGWDACVAHLALPQDYAREGRIQLIPGNEYSAYPHLLHSLFAVAFIQGGETAVVLLSWTFGVLACMGAYVLGQRVENRRCGLIAAATLATAPIFADQAGTVSIDLAFCGFTLFALSCLAAWREEKMTRWLVFAAWLVGSSCGVRHTGYLVAVLLTLFVFATGKPMRIRATLVFTGVAALAAAPWLLRSALLIGNPFYPFFSNVIGSGDMAHWNVTALGSHPSIHGLGFLQLLRFPWDIIMRPHNFDGWTKSPGPLVLLLGIPGLFVGGRRARALGLFSGAGLVCFFYFERFARYLLPFFAPMMIVAAIAAMRLPALRRGIVVVLLTTFAYGLSLDIAAIHFKIPAALGLQNSETYLAKRVERYLAFAWVNDHVPREDTVLTFDRRGYFLKGRSFQNDEPLKAVRSLSLPGQVQWLRDHNIKWVFLPVTYMQQTSSYRTEFLDMVNAWRKNGEYFRLARSFDLPRPGGEDVERVEVLEINGK